MSTNLTHKQLNQPIYHTKCSNCHKKIVITGNSPGKVLCSKCFTDELLKDDVEKVTNEHN